MFIKNQQQGGQKSERNQSWVSHRKLTALGMSESFFNEASTDQLFSKNPADTIQPFRFNKKKKLDLGHLKRW